MGVGKTTISCRMAEQQDQALEEIADTYNVSKSQIMRSGVRRVIDEHEDIIEDYQALAHVIEQEKTKTKPSQTVSHLPNNLHEFCREQIDEPYPIPVVDVFNDYHQSYVRQVEAKFEDEERIAEMKMKLDHALRMYQILHPTGDVSGAESKKACIHYARGVLEQPDKSLEDAKAWVKRRIADGTVDDVHRDEIYDALTETQREKWQTQWQEGVRANWSEEL